MKNRRNYYRILHVQPDAPTEVISASYRTLMRHLKMHPDLGGDSSNAALINEAFATLRDAQKRAAYNRIIQGLVRRRFPKPALLPPVNKVMTPKPRTADHTSSGNRECLFCDARNHPKDASSPDAVCYSCESPLVPVGRDKGSSATRRLMERMPARMRVTCVEASRPSESFDVVTQDVSLNGMLVTSRHALSGGQRLKIQCSLADAVAVVVHVAVEPGVLRKRWHVGLQFLTIRIKQVRGAFVSANA